MSKTTLLHQPEGLLATCSGWALFWLFLAVLGGVAFFWPGLEALVMAWQLPEYSHGPLIPVLSLLLFLRQLKTVPERPGPIGDRWVGVWLVALALSFATLGRLASIDDIVAYALILWVGGLVLITFGWSTGRYLWPPVLHLVYMLPLPDTLYYKLSIWLQFISSELGVWFLRLLSVPVFLEGNIIDMGVYKLHVAEACSGLRYLFPILSFSYLFAVLYNGPMWHRAVLLISAAPIAVLMNSVRIALAGVIVDTYGTEWVLGFTHFFEGWVVFVSCIVLLFTLARILLLAHPTRIGLAQAIDIDTRHILTQARRIRLLQPSRALIVATLMVGVFNLGLYAVPSSTLNQVARDSFKDFPRVLGDWTSGSHQRLEPDVEEVLGADDYLRVNLTNSSGMDVGLFMAWYADQARGGVHSPEICLPSAGWEIAWLERTDIASMIGADQPFMINRAIIQKGETRMMVFYWFDQKGRKVAWDLAAKFWLAVDGVRTGRTDGALIRLTALIDENEKATAVEARLMDVVRALQNPLPRFIPKE